MCRHYRKRADELRGVCPDLPGCIAAAETEEAVEALIREAIAFPIQGLIADGLPVPEPASSPRIVEVGVA
ncbi:MAG: type II toxin-antitoxin system HicB family antitoxin [Dehalococcoidia bacterium]